MKDGESEPDNTEGEKIKLNEKEEESMKQLNNSDTTTNEIVSNENINKNNQEEEPDDTEASNRGQEYNIRCHNNGVESNFNCQLINNNTIESFDYRKCKTDQQNRISVLKEGRHYQEAMKKEKTLKKQFSIHAEHDYHEKFSEDKIKMGERVGEVDSNEQSTCDNVTVSVVNGSETDWDTSKDVLDGGLSKPLISYHVNETDVTKQKSNEDKIDAKDNTISINYNDYRYFYNDNYKNNNYTQERDLENYQTAEYYPKSDVMFNEQRDYSYQNSSEFNNNELVNNELRQSDEMFLIQDSFQNTIMHKNINQVIADTLKNEDESDYNYINFQNGSSPKDDGSSNSSQDEKLNSKILNLSHIKYTQNSRSSVLTSTNPDYTGSYEQLNERNLIINSNFGQSPSPNGQLQSLDSPPRSLNVISSVGDAGVRFENSELNSSSGTVLQCLNPMTTSAPSGSVLQTLSPREMNSDCDTQV